MPTIEKLAWGKADLVPADARAAWGARLIITQSGDVDIVHDRQDLVAIDDKAKAALIVALSNLPWKNSLSEMLKAGDVSTSEADQVTVLEGEYGGEVLTVAGDSNGSCGYFYVAAWI